MSDDWARKMSDLAARLRGWHAAHGTDLKLRAGASEAAIAAAEAKTGLRFPDDYRAWLAVHDGQETHAGTEWAAGCNFLASLKSVVEQWKEEKALAVEYPGDGRLDNGGRTLRDVYHARRVPIAGTAYWDGDKTYLDFTPGPAGRDGQLIALTTECDFAVLGASFHAFLEGYVGMLESGALMWSGTGVAPARGRWAHPANWLSERLAAPKKAAPKKAAPKKAAPKKAAPKKAAPKKAAPKKAAPKKAAPKKAAKK